MNIESYRILAMDDDPEALSLIADTLLLPENAAEHLAALGRGRSPQLPHGPHFEVRGSRIGERPGELLDELLDPAHPYALAFMALPSGLDGPGMDMARQLRARDPELELVVLVDREPVSLDELNRLLPPPEKLLLLEKPLNPRELRQLAAALCAKWTAERTLHRMTRSLARTVEDRISRTRELEDQLRQSQKMEALGTLAGGIAHDFNNILGVIMGYAEIIRENAGRDDGLARRVEEIMVAGGRARDLISQVLNFSRQGPQEMRPVRLGPLLEEALKLLRPSLPEEVELEVRVDTDNDTVAAEPTQVHQVLLNLCTNAVHAMAGMGGRLTIALEDTPEGTALPQSMGGEEWAVRLSVADTGPGMDQATRERIFEPFFTTKSSTEGTGMGLAVAHGIVKNHGGAIEVRSEPGGGATFHVYLPRLDAQLQPEPEHWPVLEPRQGRILFVDDELPLAQIGREMLEGFGFTVVTRTSSVEALEAFRHNPEAFDLVVTDQAMPNMNGMELARELLTLRPGLPIILCTGFSDAISYKRIRALGIGAMIKKPILKSKLVAAVSRLLEPHAADADQPPGST